MMVIQSLLAVLLFVVQPPAGGKVTSEFDKKADFAAYHTYTWQKGYAAYNSTAHKLVVEAIERELAALGLKKDDTGQADLTVTYYSLRTAEVNLKEVEKLAREEKAGPAPTYTMGKLAVVVREARTQRQLWAAHTVEYLNPDEKTWQPVISGAATKLFETYPTRRKK